MSEKKKDSRVKDNRKGEDKPNKSDKGPLKVARVIYGDKNLTDCMESVLRLYIEK